MLAAYTQLKNAQKVKQFLVKKKLLSQNFLPVKELDGIYFPLSKNAKVPGAKVTNVKITFKEKPGVLTIEKLLEKNLTKNQLNLIPKSQEIVGDILILEIPQKLEGKEKIIAEAYLNLLPSIKTVVKKSKEHSGIYRTRGVKILAGKKTKETVHYENGVRIKLHLEKTYFSARSGSERLRIANQVKKGENVLVMFSGAAPYPLVIAKNSPASKIFGIEMNPLAHEFAVDNLELNKVQNVIINRGDVRLILPKLRRKFDRIVMPLPKSSEEFLALSLTKIKSPGIINLYTFLNEKEINTYTKKIRKICKDGGKIVKSIKHVKCGSFSPGVFRICFDLIIK
jgi:tRNA (guanine37-N1)-methyltransferase